MEVPALCNKCLGPDANVKILKNENGAACQLCERPFNVFMWKPTPSSRHQKTIICQTCSRVKNCCQSCMLDIHFGIPLDVRDMALKMAGIPQESYFINSTTNNTSIKATSADKQEAYFEKEDQTGKAQNNSIKAKEILSKLAEKFNSTNPPTLLKSKTKFSGKANTTNESKSGVNIKRIVNKLPFGGVISPPPEDEEIKSFFLFGIDENTPQYLINEFCCQFGLLSSITIIQKAGCGFVKFAQRSAAIEFAKSIDANGLNENKITAGLVIIDGKYPIRVAWSPIETLGHTKEEYIKLKMVVMKVIKQLAVKDREFAKTKKDAMSTKNVKPEFKNTSNNKNDKKGKRKESNGPEYKALSEDFEV